MKTVIGILAHVDAGKTSLSESMLYLSGKIKKLGRVDNQDAYFDTYELERKRGITIFSKQAVFDLGATQVTLMDTPGHVDFSAEMERVLQVLDYAILVISGSDGIQGHTKTLWRLLELYNIPVFIFVNKMDQPGTHHGELIALLKKNLSEGCIDFNADNPNEFYEQMALTNEDVMNAYIEKNSISLESIQSLIASRKVFPVFFGSALKQTGIEAFMAGMSQYIQPQEYSEVFGGKVFKISRDAQGNRLTHLKITGGRLNVRDTLKTEAWEEKVNHIRIYSGEKFDSVSFVEAGTVCAVTGLTKTRPGEGLGVETATFSPILEPVLSYRLVLPEEVDERVMMPKLRLLEEEEPELKIVWNEILKEIHIQVMGEVQLEILQSLILERFDTTVTFGEGKIVYKETILSTVEGVGHFEPLRHYSEVHLLLEPAERGSGLQFELNCSEDLLDKSWQRLVLAHLKEKNHVGVLTGSHITDMKITLVAGQAHKKHTSGGDFREATWRAVRQGLMQTQSILLEPYYSFVLEIPASLVGRAMFDIEQMKGSCDIQKSDGETVVIEGMAPVSTMNNYQKEVTAYSKGHGRLLTNLKGYNICHNQEDVIEKVAYDPERDLENPSSSVFCSQGSGFIVPWHQVEAYMHVESVLKVEKSASENEEKEVSGFASEVSISVEEIDQIMNSTAFANQGKKSVWKPKKPSQESYYTTLGSARFTPKTQNLSGEKYLLVDGYNMIFAWEELKLIAQTDLEAARLKLMDSLCNYQGIKKCQIIVVFDAYRVEGGREKSEDYHNIQVVYTGEAQTADHYIEKFAHKHHGSYQITVATSDNLQQVIIRGAGGSLLSARELKEDMDKLVAQMHQEQLTPSKNKKNTLEESLSQSAKEKLKQMQLNQSVK